MKKRRIKKLFLGKVSIRDYIVEEAVKNGDSIEVIYGDKYMILCPDDLKKGTTNGIVFQSKFDKRSYKLIDYDFKPIEQMQIL